MKNLLRDGHMTENGAGLGTVTRAMVRERAVELALIDGRAASDANPSDWDQAKRELTGGSEIDSNEAILEAAPESERWDPVHGSTGHKAPQSGSDDEDDDGRTDSARLVEEGVAEAEHDQMVQAARESPETDQ
jgi:hypothetical protein